MKVTLFRDIPTERWPSMERYADALYYSLCELNVTVTQYAPKRPFPKLSGLANTMLNYAWRLGVYPLLARIYQGDINHIIDHSYAHLLYSLNWHRTVVTCHDIAPLVFDPPGTGFSYYAWRLSFTALSQAAQIITDSRYTRTELLKNSSIQPEHIQVVPLGVNLRSNRPPSTRVDNLILHVGSCVSRKNVEALLRALAFVPEARLLQIGGQWNAHHKQLIAELNLSPRITQLGYVSEDELQYYYQTATCFVFPSFYEGFGLPVLEAMATGLPVICSNTSSLIEVANEAAMLFNPSDVHQLAGYLQELLFSSTQREKLRMAGLERAQEFTWKRTAQATTAVYHQVIS